MCQDCDAFFPRLLRDNAVVIEAATVSFVNTSRAMPIAANTSVEVTRGRPAYTNLDPYCETALNTALSTSIAGTIAIAENMSIFNIYFRESHNSFLIPSMLSLISAHTSNSVFTALEKESAKGKCWRLGIASSIKRWGD